MCLNKKLFRNPKLNPSGLDKPTIKVDCGKCPDCIKSKSNDWFVRSYYEVFCSGVPRDLYLVTLDFDNKHLPLYYPKFGLVQSPTKSFELPPGLPPYKSDANVFIPCFDNEEVKSFLARLRYYVPRFKYLCVPEYGGFLQRPHYHILFLFNHFDYVDKVKLLNAVQKCWIAGSHEDVSSQYKCGSNPLAMVRYVVNYTTKDFSFDLDSREENLPYRHRSRIMCSGHFGECALGKYINFDIIKNQGFVFIDGLKYQIPRYYEQKICYDYYWSKEEKKAYRPLNSKGVELAKDRHSKHTCHYVKAFFASRYDKIHLDSSVIEVFNYLFPNSPYNGMQWHDVVLDVMSDFKHFVDYVNIKDFLFLERCDFQSCKQRYRKYAAYRPLLNYYYDPLAMSFVDGLLQYNKPYKCRSGSDDNFERYLGHDFDLCIQACFLFDLAKMKLSERQLFYKLYKSKENQKQRAWEKIKHSPGLARYLSIKGYDFSKLYRMSYSDYYELNNSNRLKYVQQIQSFEDYF